MTALVIVTDTIICGVEILDLALRFSQSVKFRLAEFTHSPITQVLKSPEFITCHEPSLLSFRHLITGTCCPPSEPSESR